jgi:hypothetical protein
MSREDYSAYKNGLRKIKNLNAILENDLISYLKSKGYYSEADIKRILTGRNEKKYYTPEMMKMYDTIFEEHYDLIMDYGKVFQDVKDEISVQTYNSFPKYIQDDYHYEEVVVPGGRNMRGDDYDARIIKKYVINRDFA